MVGITYFDFNPFHENTYFVFDETKECVIIDPGCYDAAERKMLVDYIEKGGLKPVRLLNTHCHLDHVFGNQFIFDQYGLLPEIHENELPILETYPLVAEKYGVPHAAPSPKPVHFIEKDEEIAFGESKMKALFAPGHSPGGLCFYCESDDFVVAGDVLFYKSIGRTDLPGGDYDRLISSIHRELLSLPDQTAVFPGHAQQTTIGYERQNNPFLREG
ncbi:MAG TPA: MBL fold metallo-hydrolase [Saprospiraceae bacterium]|nr:MBL fold metallo-hydrolase [Saprospiraceae bacterium]